MANVLDSAKQSLGRISQWVKENPVAAVAIAAGVGLGLYYVSRQGGRREEEAAPVPFGGEFASPGALLSRPQSAISPPGGDISVPGDVEGVEIPIGTIERQRIAEGAKRERVTTRTFSTPSGQDFFVSQGGQLFDQPDTTPTNRELREIRALAQRERLDLEAPVDDRLRVIRSSELFKLIPSAGQYRVAPGELPLGSPSILEDPLVKMITDREARRSVQEVEAPAPGQISRQLDFSKTPTVRYIPPGEQYKTIIGPQGRVEAPGEVLGRPAIRLVPRSTSSSTSASLIGFRPGGYQVP